LGLFVIIASIREDYPGCIGIILLCPGGPVKLEIMMQQKYAAEFIE
jgi:hypothetical protein